MAGETSALDMARRALEIEDIGRACKDIPESACHEEPQNLRTHVAALALTKSADGLVDPKLVLTWLLVSLGVPGFLLGFLVPIREAGALLPQLFTAGAIRRMPLRKYAWAIGSLLQGLSALGIAVAALSLEGAQAGWVILACLAALAISRSVCSVAYKDVLGKTISKSRRGSATGLAGSLSAGLVIVFALLLSAGWIERYTLVLAGLMLAGAFWILAALLFSRLREHEGATGGGANSITLALSHLSLLKSDRQLQVFIVARALLTATALAPPFMVAASSDADGSVFQGLGYLVLASSGAALASSYVWGQLADRSSRKVLVFAGLTSGVSLALTAWLASQAALSGDFVLPILLFLLMIAYQGVRLGRSTHLVDMGAEDTRAAYTALSNTVIGLVLLAGSVFSAIAAMAGLVVTLVVMSGCSVLGGLVALGLCEVQSDAAD